MTGGKGPAPGVAGVGGNERCTEGERAIVHESVATAECGEGDRGDAIIAFLGGWGSSRMRFAPEGEGESTCSDLHVGCDVDPIGVAGGHREGEVEKMPVRNGVDRERWRYGSLRDVDACDIDNECIGGLGNARTGLVVDWGRGGGGSNEGVD